MANSEVIADMPFSTFAQGICTSLVIAQERLHPKEILKECTFFWECLLSKLRRDKLCNNKSLLWFFRKGVSNLWPSYWICPITQCDLAHMEFTEQECIIK